MQIVLLERIYNLGIFGDVVSVKPGYARNYLIPQKKALPATKNNLRVFEEKREMMESLNIKKLTESSLVAEKIKGKIVNVVRSAGDSGHLYGSVKNSDIIECLKEFGVFIEKSCVQIMSPIKFVGVHDVKICLHPDVTVCLGVSVARSFEESRRQAEEFLIN